MKNCETCEAFLEAPVSSNRAGSCRRGPPTALVHQYVSAQALDEKGAVVQILRGFVDSYFPSTRADLGCMAWMERTTKVAEESAPEQDPADAKTQTLPIAGLVAPTTH